MKNKVEHKQITMILPKGKALPLLEYLHANGCEKANLHHARGFFIDGIRDKKGVPVEIEQEILTVVVESNKADAHFQDLFERGEFQRPECGFMYMETLGYSTQFELPKVQGA